MYQLIGQPICRLAPGGRFAVWAMRAWVAALAGRGCPPGALAPAFLQCRAIEALPHFHRLMIELNNRSLETLRVAPLAHPTINECEAVVLQLWISARTDPLHARETLTLMLEEEAVEPAFEAIISAAARLAAVGLAAGGLVTTQKVDR